MSNYNSTLQSNNTGLQAILNTINELPEANGDPILQDKTVTPTTSQQTITADSGYDGLDTVTVNAIPTATQATPSISVSSSGLITASATQTKGYVTSGTKSATKQLTTQAAKTITPSTSSQTAVASGVYTTGAITVAAIPSSYVKPTTTKAATTYIPTTTNQTIAKGTYCSGVQTIKGDANLKAENIAEGVSIFGVTGTHSGGGGMEIETCSVTVNLVSTAIQKRLMVVYTILSYDGITVESWPMDTSSGHPSITIDNVVKNSLFTITLDTYDDNDEISDFYYDNMYDEIATNKTICFKVYNYLGDTCSCTIFVN